MIDDVFLAKLRVLNAKTDKNNWDGDMYRPFALVMGLVLLAIAACGSNQSESLEASDRKAASDQFEERILSHAARLAAGVSAEEVLRDFGEPDVDFTSDDGGPILFQTLEKGERFLLYGDPSTAETSSRDAAAFYIDDRGQVRVIGHFKPEPKTMRAFVYDTSTGTASIQEGKYEMERGASSGKGSWQSRDYDIALGTEEFESGRRRCDNGDGLACLNLALAFHMGRLVEQDLGRAQRLYRKGCDLGEQNSCAELSAFYLKGIGVEQDFAQAFALSDEACRGRGNYGCFIQAKLHEDGLGVRQDLRRAGELYERACETGFIRSCARAGYFYLNGIGVDTDVSTSQTLYGKGCNRGDIEACVGVGAFYAEGYGIERDLEKARTLFQQACNAGHEQGCLRLQRLLN